MADTNQNTRGQLPDNDPFAELTRIMGLDPRPAASAAAPATPAEDDFGIDLEKELMGELASDEFAQPEAAPSVQWSDHSASVAAAPAEPTFEPAPEPVVAHQPEPAASQPQASNWDESLDEVLARELLATTEFDEEEEPEAPQAVAQPQPAPQPVVTRAEPAPAPTSEEEDEVEVVDPAQVIATAAELYLNDDELWPLEKLEPFMTEVPAEAEDEQEEEATADSVEVAPVVQQVAPVVAPVTAEVEAPAEKFAPAAEAEAEAAVIDDLDFDFGPLDDFEQDDPLAAVAEEEPVAAYDEVPEVTFEADAFEEDVAPAVAAEATEDTFDFEPFELDLNDEALAEPEETVEAVEAGAAPVEIADNAAGDFHFEPFELELTDAPAEPVALEPETVHAEEPAAQAAEDDFSFEPFEFDLNDEPADEAPVVETVAVDPAPIFPASTTHLHIAPAEPSFEDELTALLNAEEKPAAVAAPAPQPAANSWQPSVNTFGRASLSEPEIASDEEPAPASVSREPEPEHDDLDNIFGDFSLDIDEPVAAEPEQAPEPVVVEAPRRVMPSVEEPDFDAIFGEDFDIHVEDEAPKAEPAPSYFPQTAVAAGAAAAVGAAAASSWTSRATPSFGETETKAEPTTSYGQSTSYGSASVATSSWGTPAAAAKEEAPEIETIEVVEAAPRLEDDLDIPEVPYEEPTPPADPFDSFEAELAHGFDDMQDPHASTAPAAAAPSRADASKPDLAEEEARWLSAPPMSDDSFDYESEVDQELAAAPYEPKRVEAAPRRRSTMLAAAVAGIVIVAAVGFVGASFFGEGSDGPALVKADDEPLKVRPENPGGTTVPNQNSKVYESVASKGTETAPGQERLISTAEEPVDVLQQTDSDSALAPGIDDQGNADDMVGMEVGSSEDDGSDELAAVMGQPKSEDRIDPAAQPAENAPAEEVATVTPRKVRTMVVRPDGTLVPREDPAPVAEAAPAQQNAVTSVLEAPAVGTPSIDGATALSAEAEDDGIVVETPQTVAVVPTPRVEPGQAPQRQAAAPQPQQQAAPAPTPASASTAAAPAGQAAGGWSMQIASQPTAEGAQAAYQDLARRYGSVLQGRGVDIVRADIEGRGTYYRVRIPASSRDEAIQLCTRYKAAGGSCFVSR